jgi:hypothetical protein
MSSGKVLRIVFIEATSAEKNICADCHARKHQPLAAWMT